MSRPAGDADKRLIQAALELIPRKGLSGLSVRQVASRAGVNLGMFHYHFHSKGEFDRRIMQEVYEKFFSDFMSAVESVGGRSPRERLRRGIVAAGIFVRENRPLLIAFGRDLLAGNREAVRFSRRNFPRHVLVLLRLMKECQKAGQMRKLPISQVLPFLFGGAIGPVVALSVIESILPGGLPQLPIAVLRRLVTSDRKLEERVDLALDAMAPSRERRRLS